MRVEYECDTDLTPDPYSAIALSHRKVSNSKVYSNLLHFKIFFFSFEFRMFQMPHQSVMFAPYTLCCDLH